MKVLLNGETREISRACTVAELVEELGLPGPTLLIEHNGVALRRNEWSDRAVTEGDQFEMMRVAAGG